MLNLVPIVFAPGETVFGTSLYVVHRGLALFGGKLLKAGMVWGEDMLLEASHLRSPFCARALNYLEVYMISREEVYAIAEHYPESKRKLRMYVCKVALRRMIVLMTREKKQLAELRLRFPDTLGVLLDRLDGAEAERLRTLKNAGVYGGWAEGPDGAAPTEARPTVAHQSDSKLLMAFSGQPSRDSFSDQPAAGAGYLAFVKDLAPSNSRGATGYAQSFAVPHPDSVVAACGAPSADPLSSSSVRRASSSKVYRMGSATGTATCSPTPTPTTSAPSPRDSASFTAARAAGAAAPPPHRGGRPTKKNNFQTESRVQATVEAVLAAS